jgi:hypothetical protein
VRVLVGGRAEVRRLIPFGQGVIPVLLVVPVSRLRRVVE